MVSHFSFIPCFSREKNATKAAEDVKAGVSHCCTTHPMYNLVTLSRYGAGRRPPVKTNVLTVKKGIVWAGKWVHFSREKLPPASKMHLLRTALQLLNRITNGIEQVI